MVILLNLMVPMVFINGNNGRIDNVEIMVPLNDFYSFWRTLEIPLKILKLIFFRLGLQIVL